MISYNSYCMNLILLEAPWKIVAIEWVDSSLPRFCHGSAQICSDFWVYFPADSTGPAADSTRVRCGPKNLWQIRHKYAAEWWTFWSKKSRKSPPVHQKSPNQLAADFFRFWRTTLVDQSPVVCRGFAVDAPKKFLQL